MSPEPFVVKGWLIAQNDCSTQVFIFQVGDNLSIKNYLRIITEKAETGKNHEAQTKNWHSYENTVYQNITTFS